MGTRAGPATPWLCTPVELLERAALGPLLSVSGSGAVEQPLLLLDLDGTEWTGDLVVALRDLLAGVTPVIVGIARTEVPAAAAPVTELLTTTLAPGGPGRHWVAPAGDDLDRIVAAVTAAPVAALTLHGLLRSSGRLRVADAVIAEATAYSMLLAGDEFARWREQTPRRTGPVVVEPVLLDRTGNELTITLNDPGRRNALGSALRDGLLDALEVAALDTSLERVVVRGAGPIYCSGGDLDEFGSASVGAAYQTRLSRNVGLAMHRVRDRLEVRMHGAGIGAGIETSAFAGRISARADTWFALPELSLGLIPGAGGTVGIPRRIGRWRTAWLVLTGHRLEAATAHAWGLVDELT